MFRWEPEGRYHHRLFTAIAPFWFSTEHLWRLIAPLWLSADGMGTPLFSLFLSNSHNVDFREEVLKKIQATHTKKACREIFPILWRALLSEDHKFLTQMDISLSWYAVPRVWFYVSKLLQKRLVIIAMEKKKIPQKVLNYGFLAGIVYVCHSTVIHDDTPLRAPFGSCVKSTWH